MDGGLDLGSVIDLEVLIQRSSGQRHPLRDQWTPREDVVRFLIALEHPGRPIKTPPGSTADEILKR